MRRPRAAPRRVACVVVAAGAGTRLGAGAPKAFVDLGGRTLLGHAIAGVTAALWADGTPVVEVLVVVAPRDALDEAARIAAAEWSPSPADPIVVPGGVDRVASVRRGLGALPGDVGTVLVHDAARCLTPPGMHATVAREVLAGHDAVVPGLAVVDTVKEVDMAAGPPWRVVATPARSTLRAVQTPQGFRREVLERAHALADGAATVGVTDDAGLVEAAGGTVWVVPGHPEALKVTTATDLEEARRILGSRAAGVAP